jgi:hypothetical protein
MKKLKTTIDKWLDKQDKRWQALPVGKQHRYTLCFFAVYLLLTAIVIAKIWDDARTSQKGMVIEPIENPVLKNLETNKNFTNERK